MNAKDDLEILVFPTRADWENWLEEHFAQAEAVLLKMQKKGAKTSTLTYQEAVKGALCFGWIDSTKFPFDAEHWLQRFSRRKKGSPWSRINREYAETLIAEGRMREGGLGAVEAAKAEGTWDKAYESQSKAEGPEDFLAALSANPKASEFYATLNRVNKYAIYFRLNKVKKAETRARKIEEYVRMLEEGRKIHE